MVYFAFEEIFKFPHFVQEQANTVAPVCMFILSVWWVTREIEASAVKFSHLAVEHEPKTVTWLLPTSRRDPYAAGEARTHGCACRRDVVHSACPYHVFVAFMDKLVEALGRQRPRLPLFPSKTAAMMKKTEVVHAYRCVIQQAGVQLLQKAVLVDHGSDWDAILASGWSCVAVPYTGRAFLGAVLCKVGIDSCSQVRAGFSTHGTSDLSLSNNFKSVFNAEKHRVDTRRSSSGLSLGQYFLG